MKKVPVYAPLIGAVVNLADVPDMVFADKLVGDGVAIEPFDCHIYAPISGVIKSIHRAKHAISLVSQDEVEILLHIGLETVQLDGSAFNLKVKVGDVVNNGDILGEFDLDLLSKTAKSLISPLLLINQAGYQIEPIVTNKVIVKQVNTLLFNVLIPNTKQTQNQDPMQDLISKDLIASVPIKISNLYGIHARPAALISAEATKHSGEIIIEKSSKLANAKSIIELLGLAVNRGDEVVIYATNQVVVESITSIINQFEDNDTKLPLITPTTRQQIVGTTNGNSYFGAVASHGLAVGRLVVRHSLNFEIIEQATDINHEQTLLLNAINQVTQELQKTIALQDAANQEIKDILATQLVLLADPNLVANALKLIKQQKTAAYAIKRTIDEQLTVLLNTNNQLLIERQADLNDIYKQILLAINGVKPQTLQLNEPTILVAHELTPLDIINLDSNIVGLVSVKGGITSHVAILSRAKQVPLLVGVAESILNLNTTNLAIIDAQSGVLNTLPTEQELDKLAQQIVEDKKRQQVEQQAAKNAAITTDGVEINCLANIASVADAMLVHNCGASGVGLFRTEFMYMDKQVAPDVDKQYQVYAEIAVAIGDYPFIIRTLDAGGEKPISYLPQQHTNNAMLGMRGIRLSLAYKEIFIKQLLAILKLNHPQVKVMLPMVSTIEEYREVKQLIADLAKQQQFANNIELGIMVEVPSVALQADIFAKEVDFFSIGTNDLTQYILAMDRENSEFALQVDHLHPAVLRAINLVASSASKYNRLLSVCGVMASETLAIPILIGLGINNLSMSINSIPANKAFIRRLDFGLCQDVAKHCLNLATATEVREYLQQIFLI
jgi:phosphoenolpyruvate-protein phosphotransferase